MKNNFQKLVSVILSVCMLLSMCSFTIFADETPASAYEVFVKQTAADGGDGTLAKPYNTLRAALNAIKAHFGSAVGEATVYVLPTGTEETSYNFNKEEDANDKYIEYYTYYDSGAAHPNITITYTSYKGDYEGKALNGLTGDHRGSIAFALNKSFYGIHMLVTGPTIFKDIVLLDMRQSGASDIYAQNYDLVFEEGVNIYSANGGNTYTADNAETTVNELTLNPSNFVLTNRNILVGGHSNAGYSTNFNKTATSARVDVKMDLATNKIANFYLAGSNTTNYPGMTYSLPAANITFIYFGGSVDANTVFTGPVNLVLNGTKVSYTLRANSADNVTFTSANIPQGLQIVKNAGAKLNVSTKITPATYDITVADTTAALDVTDTVGTYTVTGGAGVAYIAAGSKVYYQKDGKISVPAAGIYTVNTAASLAAVKAVVDPEANWSDDGNGTLTKAASGIYFVKPSAKDGNGTEAKPYGTLTEVVSAIKADHKNGLIGDKATVKIMRHGSEKASGLWNNKYDREYYLDYRTLNSKTYAHPEVEITYTSYESNAGADPDYIDDKRGRIAYGFSGSKYMHMYIAGPTKFENIILLDFRNDGTYSDIVANSHNLTFGKDVDVYQTSKFSAAENQDTTRTDVELVNSTQETPSYFKKNITKFYTGAVYDTFTTTAGAAPNKFVFEEIPTDGTAATGGALFILGGSQTSSYKNFVNLLGTTFYAPAGTVNNIQLFNLVHENLAATTVAGPFNVVLDGTTVNKLTSVYDIVTPERLPDGLQIIMNNGAKINTNSLKITAPYYELKTNGLTLDVTDTVGTYTVTGGAGIAYAVSATGKYVYYQTGANLTVPAGAYTVSSAATIDAIKAAINPDVTWDDNGAGMLTRGATKKTFYVSNVASSTENGTEANPFKNVINAVNYANTLGLVEGDEVTLIINDNYKATVKNQDSTTGYTAWAQSGGQMTKHIYTLIIEGKYGQGENGTFLATENNRAPCYNSIYMGGPTVFRNINLLMMRNGVDTTWGTSGYDATFENVTFYFTREGDGYDDAWLPVTSGSIGNIALCASSASAPMGTGGHVVMRNVKNVNKIMTGSAAPTFTGDLTIEFDNVTNDNNAAIPVVFGGYRSGQTTSAGYYYNGGVVDETIDPYNLNYVTTIGGDLNIIVNGANIYARCWDPQWSFKYCGPVNIAGNLNIIGMSGSDISNVINPNTSVPSGADASKLNSFVVAGNKYYLALTGEADVTISDDGVATSANGYFYTTSADGNTVKYTKTQTLTAEKICYANAAPSFAALKENAAADATAPLGQVFDSWTVDEAACTLTAKFATKDYDAYFVKFGVTAGQTITYGGKTGKAYPTVVDAIAAINAEGKYTAADAVPVIVLEDDTDVTTLAGYAEGNATDYWSYDSNGNYVKGTTSTQAGGFWTDASGAAGGVNGRLTAYSAKDSKIGEKHEWTLILKAADGSARKPYLAYTNRYGENSIIVLTGPTVFQNIAIVANRNVDREIGVNGYDVTFDQCTFNYVNCQQYGGSYDGTIVAGHASVMLQKGAANAVHDGKGGTVKFVGAKFAHTSGFDSSHFIAPARNNYYAANGAGDFANTVSFVFEDSVDAAWFTWNISSMQNYDNRVKFTKGLELIADGSETVVKTHFDSAKNNIDIVGGALVVMKDGASVTTDSDAIIPAALNADKKWVIKVDNYNVNLKGDGTLVTDAPYNYYVAFVDGSYNLCLGKINDGVISDLPSGTYELAFVNSNPLDNNFAEIRPMVTDDVNKQNAGSWTQKAGTNLYVAKGFTSKYVAKHPIKRGTALANRVESATEAYTINLDDTYNGNNVISIKATADGSTVKQPNIAYDLNSGGTYTLPTVDGGSVPAASVRYVTIKYYYKTVEGGGKLVGQKMLGFNVGRFYDPDGGKYYELSAGNNWFGGENNASLNTYVADQWATVTVDLWQQKVWKTGGYANFWENFAKENPNALISCLRVRPFGQTVGNPGLAAGEEFYIADYIFTDYNPMTSYDTFYVSENGTATGDGATLATALNNFEAVYEIADASGFAEVDVYVDGKVNAGEIVKNEYTGVTLNVLPLNASGDEITELTAVANLNLGAITVGKLNLVSGIVTNNNATIGEVVVGNANEVQFNQLGGTVYAISQAAGATANKVVLFVGADSKLPAVDNITANQFSIVRAPLMMNDKKTTRFAVTATDKVGVFETYSGSEYQFGWGLVPYTCYAQNDDVIFYSNDKTDYMLTIDESGDYQLMIVGTQSHIPSSWGRATYYFTTNTLSRSSSDKEWKETKTLPGEKNDFYGLKVVLFPLSPDAIEWNEDLGTGKVTAKVQENYSFDGVTYTAKKAHTVNFANFVQPIVPEGTYFAGWMNAQGAYATGSVELAAGDVLTAQFKTLDLAVEKDISVLGAQIRIKSGAQDLRFVSKVSKSLLNDLGITEYEGENVKFGTVLLPSSYPAFDEFGIGYTDTKKNTAAKVPAKKIYDSDETSLTFTAVLTKLQAVHKFTDYVARPYVEYTDKNGVARVAYGSSYDTNIWEIADCALDLDANGTRPLIESTKGTLLNIRADIEDYVDTAANGNLVRRVQSSGHSEVPLFQTEGTGRHTDVHLAYGKYEDVTEDQFAHGKAFYYTNYGTVIREVHITGGTAKTEVGVLTDTHFELINYNGPDMYDPEYLFTAQTRSSWNSERVDNSFINAAKVATLYDKMIVTGDVIDYTAYASLDFLEKQITSRFDNDIYIIGNHDATKTVGSTGVSDAFGKETYKKAIAEYWVNDPDDLDGDGDINEIEYHSEVINGVMLVNIDNGSDYQYSQKQLDDFKRDLAIARENGYTILMFQHIPIATGDPADVEVHPTERYGDKWNGTRNYYNVNTGYSTANSKFDFSYNFSKPNNAVNDEMYTLITNNTDIIRGLFTGHLHQSEYCEILPRDKDGNVYDSEMVDGKITHYYIAENGEKVYVPTLPQFGMASSNYVDYTTANGVIDRGTMVKIVVNPAN